MKLLSRTGLALLLAYSSLSISAETTRYRTMRNDSPCHEALKNLKGPTTIVYSWTENQRMIALEPVHPALYDFTLPVTETTPTGLLQIKQANDALRASETTDHQALMSMFGSDSLIVYSSFERPEGELRSFYRSEVEFSERFPAQFSHPGTYAEWLAKRRELYETATRAASFLNNTKAEIDALPEAKRWEAFLKKASELREELNRDASTKSRQDAVKDFFRHEIKLLLLPRAGKMNGEGARSVKDSIFRLWELVGAVKNGNALPSKFLTNSQVAQLYYGLVMRSNQSEFVSNLTHFIESGWYLEAFAAHKGLINVEYFHGRNVDDERNRIWTQHAHTLVNALLTQGRHHYEQNWASNDFTEQVWMSLRERFNSSDLPIDRGIYDWIINSMGIRAYKKAWETENIRLFLAPLLDSSSANTRLAKAVRAEILDYLKRKENEDLLNTQATQTLYDKEPAFKALIDEVIE